MHFDVMNGPGVARIRDIMGYKVSSSTAATGVDSEPFICGRCREYIERES